MFRRLGIALLALALAAGMAPPAPAVADELPPGPSFPIQSKFEAAAPAGAYEIVQFVLDFAPGAQTPRHTHGGQVFVTMLSGELRVRDDAGEKVFRTGDSWAEQPGDYHLGVNVSGENARVLATFVLPQGASLTTVEESTGTADLPPGPTLVYQSRTEGLAHSGPLEVVQLVADFPSGTWTPYHEHGGRGVVMTVEGQLTVRDSAGERTFGPGESWVEGQGEVASVGNAGTQNARAVATFLLPKGAALTTVRDAPASGQVPSALPRTGAAADPPWMLLAGLALALAGLALRRRAA